MSDAPPRHNIVRVHLTEGDAKALLESLPEHVYKRSQAQHILARIVDEAMPQIIAQRERASREGNA